MSRFVFEQFFGSGEQECFSPFLHPSSRKWAKHLSLKGALLSSLLLLIAFILLFYDVHLSHLALVGVYFFVGTPALIETILHLRRGDINIDVLMILAALFSLVIGSGLEGGLLLVLFELSHAMEHSVLNKTKSALITLKQLSPKVANVVKGHSAAEETLLTDIEPGTTIMVRPGETIPLDGIITSGSSFVHLAHLTGESEPLPLSVGKKAVAGAQNLDGVLFIKVTHASTDSTLARMIHLITEAQESKPRLETLLDRFGKIYSTSIILLSLVFALILPKTYGISFLGVEGGLYRALAFLVAASPCALIIATPTAYFSSISSCAKKGILLKGSSLLDQLARCRTVAFDKTGTLTTGNLVCTHIETIYRGTETPPCTEMEIILAIAASLEDRATHPIALAILQKAKKHNTSFVEVVESKQIAGLGIEGTITLNHLPYPVFIGHLGAPCFEGKKMTLPLHQEEPRAALFFQGNVYGFYFEDQLRPHAKPVIHSLKKLGKQVWMLTGDHQKRAQEVALALQIDQFYAELDPKAKLSAVTKLAEQEEVIMVGDGINDAPSLAKAHVGIAMGRRGSGAALYAADVILLQEDLSLIPWLLKKSLSTTQIVKENLLLALSVICLASVPALLGKLPLWLAVVLHEGGTCLVALNSLRLLRK